MAIPPWSGVRRSGSTLNSSPRPVPAGVLIHKDHTGKVLGRKKIYPNREIVIGRDKTRCQYVLDDPYCSKRHLRIYTVVYENDEPSEVDALIYAEDLSQNGTYWNGSFIGKGNGGFLLSDQDVLRLSRRTFLLFTIISGNKASETFDYTQETEMAKFRNDYVLTDRLLGAGAFGKVYMALEQTIRYQVACKVVDLRVLMPGSRTQFGRPDQPAAAEDVDGRVQIRKVKAWGDQQKRKDALERQLSKYYREVDILASISHPNIIGIEKVYITDNTIYIMQHIVTAGDLFSYIESKNGKLLEVEAAVIIRQILTALSFLHNKNIVHRDIKPDNVLMTSLAAGCRVILTDFGAARRIESKLSRMSSIIGTHEYAAPEILGYLRSNVEPERPGYTRTVDMWAVGCVTVVLLTGGLAFCDPVTNMYSEKLARDCNLEFLRKSKEWQVVRQRPKEFVEKLLVLNEDARMSAEEALRHSWFCNEVHKNDFEELYQRTIRHWQPRIPKSQVVEFQDSGFIRDMACSMAFRDLKRRSNLRVHLPIEPPYKPFPGEVLSAIENWSPESAHSRRIRAACLSPRSGPPASPSTDVTVARSSRRIRAASEPPPNRYPIQLQRAISSANPRNSQKSTILSAHNTEQHNRVKSGEMKSVSRMSNPEARKVLFGKHSRSPSDLITLSASPVSATASNTEQTPRANIDEHGADAGVHQSLMPNVLRKIENSSKQPTIGEREDDLSAGPDVNTPQSHGKLKRRVSTSLTIPAFKKRRGSIFDLAEDTDTDGSPKVKPRRGSIFDLAKDNDRFRSSRLPRMPLVHRPKGVLATKPQLKNLYLPR